MSAKMEERSIKTLKAWLDFGRGFQLAEVIDMEASVLHELDFKLSLPTSLSFFHAFSTYYRMEPRTMALCSYLVELTLIDCNYLKYCGHVIGLAAIYFAFKILGINEWNEVPQLFNLENNRVDSSKARRCERMCQRPVQNDSAGTHQLSLFHLSEVLQSQPPPSRQDTLRS